MSAGEHRAWQVLRSLRNEDIHVVRQHRIGRYTVDFAVRKARVAIEVDGGVHDFPGRAEYDVERQRYIEAKGWTVVRFRTEQTHDSKLIIDAIRAALPFPLKGGGGGWDEAPAAEIEAPRAAGAGVSPHPLAPSSQEEGEFPRNLQRRTRANRKLSPRRKI